MNLPFVGTYRTKSGWCYFRWSFERQNDGTIRAYILNAPGYGNRSTNGHTTHRYVEGNRNFICFEPMPANIDDAIAVAKEWAERTEAYIRYSDEF